MPNIKDFYVSEEDDHISLTKLVGMSIKDIYGSVGSTENTGEACFTLTYVVLENGRKIWVGGEHDCAYLSFFADDLGDDGNLDIEILNDLAQQAEDAYDNQ